MLSSVDAIVKALGGTAAAASLAGVGMSAVSNWKQRKSIPSENFLAISQALAKLDKGEPDPAVFGFKEPAEVRA